MTARPAFYSAHNCICAYADTSILDFYKDYYDAVYIILHPFIQADNNGKVTRVITWIEMLQLTGFHSINQLDIALRNWIGGLKRKWWNNQDVELLINACKAGNIMEPSEGQFQDALMNNMLNSLQEQGHQFVFVTDEFGEERKVQLIQEMIDATDKPKFSIGGHDSWYTPQNEILYTVNWDSHFTLLCSDKSTVSSILDKHPFEGFYCDDKTEIYWSVKDELKTINIAKKS